MLKPLNQNHGNLINLRTAALATLPLWQDWGILGLQNALGAPESGSCVVLVPRLLEQVQHSLRDHKTAKNVDLAIHSWERLPTPLPAHLRKSIKSIVAGNFKGLSVVGLGLPIGVSAMKNTQTRRLRLFNFENWDGCKPLQTWVWVWVRH